VLNVGVVKDITGNGVITADRKGEANEIFRCRTKLILGTNDVPNLEDIDDAIRGRVRVVPFGANVPATLAARGEQLHSVAEVVDALMAEAPGILQDLVAAVGEWRANGRKLGMPSAVYEATKQYLVNQDPLVPWMEACCEPDSDKVELPFATWYWSFLLQADRDPRYTSKKWFAKQLDHHKFARREDYRGKFYTGPRLTLEAKILAEQAAKRAIQKESGGNLDIDYGTHPANPPREGKMFSWCSLPLPIRRGGPRGAEPEIV
jgi:phage/plasmid-associated DNA primase